MNRLAKQSKKLKCFSLPVKSIAVETAEGGGVTSVAVELAELMVMVVVALAIVVLLAVGLLEVMLLLLLVVLISGDSLIETPPFELAMLDVVD